MKKILLLLLLLLSQGITFANNSPTIGEDGPLPPQGGDGANTPTTGTAGPEEGPIDTNKAVLIITAALIAGVMGYRKTSLRKV